ncbi:MAG: CoA-binding protein [Deltaproteobacteria bacterium HGW-Deltaproteobacteria-12]|jgi:acyl-CoA synthetase (NDP forming)|nr:MAG: CoA-binding protein [Deltaproteobacteria bacterium HGW-Deltaproteobacteria-12]
MDKRKLIARAKKEGRTALTEAEAKQVLGIYGIPVVKEAVVFRPEDAVQKARQYGFPVVLKGLGSKLTHKTERGLVRLNLKNSRDILTAATAIARSAGEDLEGFLVQPMIKGRREFVAGLFCDQHFGPIIMFGLGGIFTEALGDVVFRIAPVSEVEAGLMIDELHSSKLLDAFRGESAAWREDLVRTIVGLSRLAEELTDITEVDINPLVIGSDGRATAVDALIIIGERSAAASAHPPVQPAELKKIFYPRSLALIGASSQLGKWGNMLFSNVLAGGYEGELYLVNAKGQEIAGRKVYKTVREIPGEVDLGIVTLPAAHVPALIPEFQAKGIRYMLLITSGFSELGSQGRQSEADLVEAARQAGITIIGPNTMGICNPHAKFYCTGSPCWPKMGSVGLVSQSGNLGIQLLDFAEAEGIGIRAFCGSGNEAMITIEDYIRTFEADEMTKTVLLYIESIKDGRRFFSTARQVSKIKPVVLLKGGRTAAGNRAAASHTGALASNIRIFNAACRQAGVVLADQPMDLLDLSAAFSSLPLPRGKRVAIMTLGGGWGVVATDLCIEQGLEVPPLTQDVIARIDKILPPYWSRENPVDLVGEFDTSMPRKILEALVNWDQCDAVIHLGLVGRTHMVVKTLDAARASGQEIDQALYNEGQKLYEQAEKDFFACSTSLMEKYAKPIIGVFLDDTKSRTVTEVPDSPYRGIAFLTPERAVKTLSSMVAYSRWLKKEQCR